MARIEISAEAEQDIARIAIHTMETWGWRQTHRYLAQLEDGIELIAGNSAIGRSCESIRAGLRRFEVGQHVVFYMIQRDGILVVRVLHQNMLPTNYI